MKTQETLSIRPNQQFKPGSLTTEDSVSSHSQRIENRTTWRVTVKSKDFTYRSPRIPQPHARVDSSGHPSTHRWGLILAGGDGTRLRDLTRWVCGDDRPKQFCPLLDSRTLLETTRQRAERSLPPDQIVVALTRNHEAYYRNVAEAPSTAIIQPSNRGTAPAILSGLLHIAGRDPDAVVAILPSDHYYQPETGFTKALETAMAIAEQHSDSVVLLGAPAQGPEVEYGWIEVGEANGGHPGLFQVQGFQEKPARPVAEALYQNGSLWNMFVLVGRARTFLEIASRTLQDVLVRLQSFTSTSAGQAIEIPDSLYTDLAPVDFSSRVLASEPSRLLALRMDNVEWNDLGDPYRVLVTLVERDGQLPAWAKLWPESGDEPRILAAHA